MTKPSPGYEPCVKCGRSTYWRTFMDGYAVPVCGEGVGHNLGGHFETKFVPEPSARFNAAIGQAHMVNGQVAIIRFPPQDPMVVTAITEAVRKAGQRWIKDEHIEAWMGRPIPALAGLTPIEFARLFDVDLLVHFYERRLRVESA